MAGDILIIDCVSTSRIVLKVKLLAAQYRVRPCANIEDAREEIKASLPDLILIDTCVNVKAAHELCRSLKIDSRTNLVPIIATGDFEAPRERVNALMAGADDVLSKPFDDHILQARIRSLLRARDARQELRMREGTWTALGFGRASGTFTKPARIIVARGSDTTPANTPDLNLELDNASIQTMLAENLIQGDAERENADLFVLDFRNGLSEDKELFRLLSELRSRSATRRASILTLLPRDACHAAAMALDLGANDINCASADPEELRHRCATLIQAKHEADSLRRTVESGLEAAITDPLTGLFNRRYAMPHLARLSAESQRSGWQFAIMVLDLDHFKSINDTYGHSVGDEILCQTARRLQDNLRAVDLLARIGGEEFLIAIPNSDVVHARIAAERLCKLIGSRPFFVGPDRTEVNVTMSVGVSLSCGEDTSQAEEDLGELVNAADVALYAAKNGGRNKVSLSLTAA